MRDDPDQSVTIGKATPEMLWLLGQPHLADYLDFVESEVAGGAAMSRRALTDEWRAANDIYYDLEEAEAGIADAIACRPVGRALRPLVAALAAHPHYRETFDKLPTTVEMVELDKLIVSQTYVTCSFSEGRARGLDASADAAALLNYCQPLDRPAPPVRIEQTGDGSYLFTSESTDLRPHHARLLRDAELAGIQSFGTIAGMIGLPVGFGSNFFTAIRSDSRLVLHNGYHRAHAMRAAGITHAPCVVQTVTRKDELRIAASTAVAEDPEFYFRSRRPPLLKDFFDPRLTRRFRVRPRRTVVEVAFSMRRAIRIEADDA